MGRGKTDRNRVDSRHLKVLGQRLKKVRVEKGLSLGDLGLIIDKDRQSIFRVESGEINIGYLYLLKLCEGLEISISELLKDLE
jgi:putative transcriptional regulator